ncbi:hypothetical protein C8R44DRAFT_745112 [Mycena epipterygia]|nr:hypothetical protein C8R44DRAFT_745112 [Mycena epipterygia]
MTPERSGQPRRLQANYFPIPAVRIPRCPAFQLPSRTTGKSLHLRPFTRLTWCEAAFDTQCANQAVCAGNRAWRSMILMHEDNDTMPLEDWDEDSWIWASEAPCERLRALRHSRQAGACGSSPRFLGGAPGHIRFSPLVRVECDEECGDAGRYLGVYGIAIDN